MDCRLPRPARHRAAISAAAVTVVAAGAAFGLTSSAPALAATPTYAAKVEVVPAGGLAPSPPLAAPDGIAVLSGTTYVVDTSGGVGRVLTMNASGTVLAVTTLTGITDPTDIAVTSTTAYISDATRNQVVSITLPTTGTTTVTPTVVVNAAGTAGAPDPALAASASPLTAPRGLALDGSGNLYIAATGNHQVVKVAGTALSIVAGNGSSAVGAALPGVPGNIALDRPQDVAVDASGAVFIAEAGNGATSGTGRVDRIDPSTGMLSSLGSAPSPTSLGVAPGVVVVAGGTGAVALDSINVGSGTPVATSLTNADAVAVSSAGTVWLVDDNGTSSKVWTAAPNVSVEAPIITTPSTLTVPTGALSKTLSATGSPSSWQLLSTSASWLTIDGATGTLSGTAVSGTFTVVVRASNAIAPYDKTFTLKVGAVPAAPAAAPKATPGQGSATVTWTAPTASSRTEEAVTGYTVTPYVGEVAGTPVTAAATATSTVVSGLKSGTSYTFKVAATNAFGTGAASAASATVTPFGGVVQPADGLTRYEGTTRVQTAISVSQELFPDTGSSRAVVIASSTNFADSLAGARLASAVGGPLLLTDPLALNSEVAAEVARVLAVPSTTATPAPAASAGSAPSQTAVGTVYLLGGTSAVSAAVETAVKAVNAKYAVTRINGTDRFDTAVKIAAQTAVDDGGASAPIYVASGTNYPDGLAVAALAARTNGVVLLTDGSTMPDATLGYLQTYDPNSELLVAVGGPAAKATDGHGAERAVIGSDRYDTARKVAELFTSPSGSAPVRSVGLATGQNWPDALAGAAAMGNLDGPLLLTPPGSLAPSTSSALTSLAKKGRPSSALVFGGSGVVSSGTATSFSKDATG